MDFTPDYEEDADYVSFIAFAEHPEAAAAVGRGLMIYERVEIATDMVSQFAGELPLNVIAALSELLTHEDVRSKILDKSLRASLATRLRGLLRDFDDTTAYFVTCFRLALFPASSTTISLDMGEVLGLLLDVSTASRHHWRTQFAICDVIQVLFAQTSAAGASSQSDHLPGESISVALLSKALSCSSAIMKEHARRAKAEGRSSNLFQPPASHVLLRSLDIIAKAASDGIGSLTLDVPTRAEVQSTLTLLIQDPAFESFRGLAQDLDQLLRDVDVRKEEDGPGNGVVIATP